MRAKPISLLMVAVFAGTAWGQSSDAPPPITWCERAADNPEWKRQTIRFALTPPVVTKEFRPVLPIRLGRVLEGIVAAYLEINPGLRATADSLMHGDARYTPRLMRTRVAFVLRHDGTVNSIRPEPGGDSILLQDWEMSIRMAAAARLLPSWSDSASSQQFHLFIETDEVPTAANWPAFTLYAPVSRPALARGGNARPSYPDMRWMATVLFQFTITEDGAIDPTTIRSIAPPDMARASRSQRDAYARFVKAVERVLPGYRFIPAEAAGCRVRSVAELPFEFIVK